MIIDEIRDSRPTAYLKKTSTVLAVYGCFILIIILLAIVPKSLFGSHLDTRDLCAGLLFFAIVLMVPLGLFYSWKSYRYKEGTSRDRLVYFIAHLFFCIIVIVLIMSIVNDNDVNQL